MYKCSVCGKGVLVRDLPAPIRICKCTVKKERKPEGFVEKLKAFFGKKYYIERLAPISCDMDGHAYGKSQFSN